MNFKKSLTTLLAVIMMFSVSTSAFADSADIRPTVVGIADTRETALTYIPGNSYSLFLSDAQDKDWFKWTNTSGQGKYISVAVMPQGSNIDYRLGVEIVFKDGTEMSRIYAPNEGMGAKIISNIYLPDGATVYSIVYSNGFTAPGQYNFILGL